MKRKFVVIGSCLCSKGFEIDSYDKKAILEKAFQVAEELGCADMTKSNWWKLFDMSGNLLYESYSWSAVKNRSRKHRLCTPNRSTNRRLQAEIL